MATKAYSKVVYNGKILIDLTNDTVEASKLLNGIKAHDKAGNIITGTCMFNADTSDATAAAGEILIGKTAYVKGSKVTGTMPNQGQKNLTITNASEPVTIPRGYHDGTGAAGIGQNDIAALTAGNIKQGITILGIEGTLRPSDDVKASAQSVTPKSTDQTVLPKEGEDYISQVTVKAVPYTEVDNEAGGITVTIL